MHYCTATSLKIFKVTFHFTMFIFCKIIFPKPDSAARDPKFCGTQVICVTSGSGSGPRDLSWLFLVYQRLQCFSGVTDSSPTFLFMIVTNFGSNFFRKFKTEVLQDYTVHCFKLLLYLMFL